MSDDITMKVINIVTDGCSNIGGDPGQAALKAHGSGIIVTWMNLAKRWHRLPWVRYPIHLLG